MSNRIRITQKGVEWQIMSLKKDGILERIGPARGGYWKIIKK
jgi:ATP-dependent DNA helicase RecG